MNKGIIAIVACGLLLLICLVLHRLGKDKLGTMDKPGITSAPPVVTALPAGNPPATQPKNQTSSVNAVLVPRNGSTEPDEITSAPHPDFVWYKPTSRGAIKNSKVSNRGTASVFWEGVWGCLGDDSFKTAEAGAEFGGDSRPRASVSTKPT